MQSNYLLIKPYTGILKTLKMRLNTQFSDINQINKVKLLGGGINPSLILVLLNSSLFIQATFLFYICGDTTRMEL